MILLYRVVNENYIKRRLILFSEDFNRADNGQLARKWTTDSDDN